MVNRSSKKKKTCIISFERNKESAVIKHMHAAVNVLTLHGRPGPTSTLTGSGPYSCGQLLKASALQRQSVFIFDSPSSG